MTRRTASRVLLLAVLLGSGVVHAVSAGREPGGTDGDGLPAGLSADEEVAWVFAHAPVLHVYAEGSSAN